MTRARVDPTCPRRGLRREDAARYLGIGTTVFDALVADGTLPRAKFLKNLAIWDRQELDAYFEVIPAGQRSRPRRPDDGIDP